MKIRKDETRLLTSPRAVITQFLSLPGNERTRNVIRRIEKLGAEEVNALYQKVVADFSHRHRNLEKIFTGHYNKVAAEYPESLDHLSAVAKLLLGAFFTKEYSIQSAALFNPSIVSHPDQTNLQSGEHRFIMSLRATGEGHISSIVFQTGKVNREGAITLDPPTGYFTPLKKKERTLFKKKFLADRLEGIPGFDKDILLQLPDEFTAAEARKLFNETTVGTTLSTTEEILDSNYDLENSTGIPFNEKVIFPVAKAESMGMEDVRFVKFSDGENSSYYGTYTAYNGSRIKTQLIETTDFHSFKIRTLYGAAIADKGMALLPEKVNGKYVMISRQGGELINIMYSDDLYRWENYQLLMEPQYTWELLQLGNCGSPVKTEKGWLLLTHGVTTMRTYVISAILLDLHNPSKIIARLKEPLLVADENEREGYVPNVAYTCGCLLHDGMLLIPYAISDAATQFATLKVNDLLDEMEKNF